MKKIQLFKPWMIWPEDLKKGRYKICMNYDLTLEGWKGIKDSSNESHFALYFTDEGEFMDWKEIADE